MIFTFIPDPRDAQEAAFQARMMDRALSLWTDGYTFTYGSDVWPDSEYQQNCYGVTSPEGKTYVVHTRANTCDCPSFEKRKYCKHLIACHLLDKRRAEAADTALGKHEAEEDARALQADMHLAALLHRQGIGY